MEEKIWDIVGVGASIADIAVEIERLPVYNEPISMLDYTRQGGGMMATAIVAAARLGSKCTCISAVGDDGRGRFCLEDYKRHGIDTSHCHVEPGRDTVWSVALAVRSDQSRNLITYRENAARPRLEHLDEGLIASAKCIHLYDREPQSREVTMTAAKMARKHNTKVSVDAFIADPFFEELLPFSDIWIASERYYDQTFPDHPPYETCLREMYEKGPEVAIITLGEKGAVGYDRQGFFQVDAFQVPVVKDTTGAGDTYHGAFLSFLTKGWDVRKCARYAGAVSAIKCTRMGGRAGLPDLETTLHFVETGEIRGEELDRRVEEYRTW